MAYTRHKQGLYRTGFRPYGLTNPWSATQLNGYSIAEATLGQVHPFGPWMLHGGDAEMLGQTHPFTPGGGWGLHGLGAMVPDQSIVTWTGQISGSASKSVQDVVAEVIAGLQGEGLSVLSTSGLPFQIFDINIQLSSAATVTLKILVANGMGFGNPNDIASVVNHEIYLASGVMPSGGITNVQAPAAPDGGSPQNAPSGADGGHDLSTSAAGDWLQQNAVWLGLGLLGIVIAQKYL